MKQIQAEFNKISNLLQADDQFDKNFSSAKSVFEWLQSDFEKGVKGNLKEWDRHLDRIEKLMEKESVGAVISKLENFKHSIKVSLNPRYGRTIDEMIGILKRIK